MPNKKTKPSPVDYDPDLDAELEPLSLEMRVELDVIDPFANIRHLAEFLEGAREFQVPGSDIPGITFGCPNCGMPAKATVSSKCSGPFYFECGGACAHDQVAAKAAKLAPFAFQRRDDFVTAFPEKLAADVLAWTETGQFIEGAGNPTKLVRALCGHPGNATTSSYTGPSGQTLVIVFRREGADGKRKSLPQVHCRRNSHGVVELTKGLPPGPWPVFNWHELRRRPDATALICEGEKAAKKAAERFPEFVVTTSLCGARNADKTDWSPLRDRADTVVWRDNDPEGEYYAESAAAQAIAAGAKKVRIAKLPEGLPISWDLGDELPAGLTLADIREAIAAAPEVQWDDVKHAVRRPRDQRQWPPFRLPDGHFRRNKKMFAAAEEALSHIDPACYRSPWMATLGGVFHMFAEDGLDMAIAWSRRDNERHHKFEEGEVERIFESFSLNPIPRPMAARELFWKAYHESAQSDSDGKGWRPEADVLAEAELAAFESEHRKLIQGNNVYIGIQERQPDGTYRIERKSEKVAESIYMSRRVVDFAGDKYVSIFKLWEHNQRVKPLKMVFRPGEEVGFDEFNTFQGFDVKPVKGSGSYKLFDELLDRIAVENGDETEWLKNAIAYRLQFPMRLMGSAFVLLGPQGSGKSTVSRTIATLLAPYSVRISEPERFVGRNNACLDGKLFVQAEEMVLGRREDYGHKLNNYITNDVIDIEEKFRAQSQVENRLWIGMTSNSEAVVRVGPGTRRFAMFRVSDPFKGDEEQRSKHYGALVAELESGGYEALMYDLMHREIPASFNPRNVPKTPLYLELVGATFDRDPVRAWWHELLEQGQISCNESKDQLWTAPIGKERLYGEFTGWCDKFYPNMRALVPSYAEWAKKLGAMLPGGLPTKRIRRKEGGGHFLLLPSYEECCAHFEEMFDVKLDRAPEPTQLRSIM